MTNEKRLIDANALYEAAYKAFSCRANLCDECYSEIINLIDDAPTVEAVEVVRCKDCWKSGDGLCSYQLKNVPGKDYCGDGERK